MLQIENAFETTTESNFYQNNENVNIFKKSNNTQRDYSEQEPKESSSTNKFIKIQQVKYNYLRKKLGLSHFSQKVQKSKTFNHQTL